MANRWYCIVYIGIVFFALNSCNALRHKGYDILDNAQLEYELTDEGDIVKSILFKLNKLYRIKNKYLIVKVNTMRFDVAINTLLDTNFYNEVQVEKLPFGEVRIIPEDKLAFRLIKLENVELEKFRIVFRVPVKKKFLKIKMASIIDEKTFVSLFNNEPLFDESDLPVININTQQSITSIEDTGTVIVFNKFKKGHYKKNDFIDYSGKCNIKIRGNTSKLFRKKGFKLELADDKKKNHSLLGLPKENDWVLYGPYKDISLIRNKFAYNLFGDMGYYSTRLKFCELIINNEYLGIYLLTEKIKADKNRVNIDKEHNTADSICSFIVKIDSGDELIFVSDYKSKIDSGWRVYYMSVYPKYENLSAIQRKSIKSFIGGFESALLKPDNSYLPFIDLKSFVDYFILNELTRNIDAYRLSTYVYKDYNTPMKIGPAWDFNYSLGLTNYNDGYKTDGWVYDDTAVPFWWGKLLEKDDFKALLAQRWIELRKGILATDSIFNRIDLLVNEVDATARDRNFIRWEVFNTNLWVRNTEVSNYNQEIEYIKNWIEQRMLWMDENI